MDGRDESVGGVPAALPAGTSSMADSSEPLEQDFDGWVVTHAPEIVRFALVVGGDRATADALIEQAVARTRLDAGADEPSSWSYALRVWTVRAELSEDRELGRPAAADLDTPVEVDQPVEVDRDVDGDRPAGLAQSFRSSSRLQRAVTVLHHREHLDAAEIADIVGSTPEGITAYFDEISRRLDVGPDRGHTEVELRRMLHVLGSDVGPGPFDLLGTAEQSSTPGTADTSVEPAPDRTASRAPAVTLVSVDARPVRPVPIGLLSVEPTLVGTADEPTGEQRDADTAAAAEPPGRWIAELLPLDASRPRIDGAVLDLLVVEPVLLEPVELPEATEISEPVNLDHHPTAVVRTLAVLVVLAGLDYLVYRWAFTAAWSRGWIAGPLLVAETFTLVDLVLRIVRRTRSPRPAGATSPVPRIDLPIPAEDGATPRQDRPPADEIVALLDAAEPPAFRADPTVHFTDPAVRVVYAQPGTVLLRRAALADLLERRDTRARGLRLTLALHTVDQLVRAASTRLPQGPARVSDALVDVLAATRDARDETADGASPIGVIRRLDRRLRELTDRLDAAGATLPAADADVLATVTRGKYVADPAAVFPAAELERLADHAWTPLGAVELARVVLAAVDLEVEPSDLGTGLADIRNLPPDWRVVRHRTDPPSPEDARFDDGRSDHAGTAPRAAALARRAARGRTGFAATFDGTPRSVRATRALDAAAVAWGVLDAFTGLVWIAAPLAFLGFAALPVARVDGALLARALPYLALFVALGATTGDLRARAARLRSRPAPLDVLVAVLVVAASAAGLVRAATGGAGLLATAVGVAWALVAVVVLAAPGPWGPPARSLPAAQPSRDDTSAEPEPTGDEDAAALAEANER